MKAHLILGGPGCGKTTRLLDIVREELACGLSPREIAFVAFTRAAANEARSRMGLPEDDLPWFRTIHSLAYNRLGMGRDEIINRDDWKEFSNRIGFPVGTSSDDGLPQGSFADKLLRVCDYSAATMAPLDVAYHEIGEDLPWRELVWMDECYRRFKTSLAKLDFTDVLLAYAAEGDPVPVRVAIIDEAQDLTRAQWKAVERAFRDAKRIYIAGDDDQAIYRWAGADVERFLTLSTVPEVLPISHRLPRRIFIHARRVAARISRRYAKDFRPSDREGSVTWHQDLESLDPSEGTWLMISRNGYLLDEVKERVTRLGLPYATREGPSVVPEEAEGIRLWGELRADPRRALTAAETRTLYSLAGLPRPALRETGWYHLVPQNAHKMMEKGNGREPPGPYLGEGSSGLSGQSCTLENHFGLSTVLELKAPWEEVFTTIPRSRADHYRSMTMEAMLAPPRIRVETIHGVKGAEADNVLLLTDISWKTSQAYDRDPDTEHRVFYVGITRARESLHIVSPQRQSSLSYTI